MTRREKQAQGDAWQPDPDNKPQCDAYNTEAFEVLYGGAAGGGKSDLLLGLARTRHKQCLLLRRAFPDLERSLIERSLQFFGDRKLYNASRHVWRIGEQRIEFGHLEHAGTARTPGDESQYASAAYDLIGVDQLEQFPRYVYEFLFSRARTTDKAQRVRVVSSANPVGENIDWIIERWGAWLDETHPHPAQPGELRWYKRDAHGRDVETTADDPDALSRTFIPARLSDNKHLDDGYRRQLSNLPEPLRSALLNGDWKASITDDAYQVIPRGWVKLAQARWKPDGAKVTLSAIGLDVARGGDDKTTICPRYGAWFGELIKFSGFETNSGAKVVRRLEDYLLEIGAAKRTGETIFVRDDNITLDIVNSQVPVMVDVIGVGSSVFDTARMCGINAIAVNWSSGSDAKDKSGALTFINLRAEHWWRMREALDPQSENPIALPPDSELTADLCAPRWTSQSNGIKIESKEDIKKRIARSPDCGDGGVLANAESVTWWMS